MTDKPGVSPCAHCGGTRIVRCNGAVNAREYMRCRDCGAHGPMADNRYAAIEAWNTRATPSQPDASALVEALAKHRPIVIEQVDSGMWSLVLRFSNAHVMRDTADALRAALTAWEAQHG